MPDRPAPPRATGATFTAGQVILGAAIGSRLDLGSISSLQTDWSAVLVSSSAIVALCVGAVRALPENGISTATAVFAMLGGAPSLTATARTLGADDRVVTAAQYLRVLIIVAAMPFVLNELLKNDPGSYGAGSSSGSTKCPPPPRHCSAQSSTPRPVSFSSPSPSSSACPWPAGCPYPPAPDLSADRHRAADRHRSPRRERPEHARECGLCADRAAGRPALHPGESADPGQPAAPGHPHDRRADSLSAGLGFVLARVTGHTLTDGYLATSPGGLYPVLAAAVSNDSDVTFVLSVQIARHTLILLSVPLLTQLISRRASQPAG